MKLDLGCGARCRDGFTGVDCLKLDGVEVVHDLNALPYPFDDDSVDEIWLDQVIEHLQSPIRVVEELWRICRHDAIVHIGVPYFRSRYMAIDPTHVTAFSVSSFGYFDPEHALCQRYQYTHARFKVEEVEFDREWRESGSRNGIFHNFVRRFGNKRPETYETRLSHLYPLNSLTFTLRALKKTTSSE